MHHSALLNWARKYQRNLIIKPIEEIRNSSSRMQYSELYPFFECRGRISPYLKTLRDFSNIPLIEIASVNKSINCRSKRIKSSIVLFYHSTSLMLALRIRWKVSLNSLLWILQGWFKSREVLRVNSWQPAWRNQIENSLLLVLPSSHLSKINYYRYEMTTARGALYTVGNSQGSSSNTEIEKLDSIEF